MQCKWLRNVLPSKAKDKKTNTTDTGELSATIGSELLSKTNSFDSLEILSSPAWSEDSCDSPNQSVCSRDVCPETISSPSSLHETVVIPLLAPSKNHRDASVRKPSIMTLESLNTLSDFMGPKTVTISFECDDMSGVSDEADLPMIISDEQHIIEWRFKSPDNRVGWYTGPLLNKEVPHGRGTCVLESGDKYDGPFDKGDMHGPSATFIESNGNIYRGDFFNNLPDGFGTYKTSSRCYVGKFECGKPHGNGTLYYHDGSIDFVGRWVDGEPIVDIEGRGQDTLTTLIARASLGNFIASFTPRQH
jgi:hypothetical protein